MAHMTDEERLVAAILKRGAALVISISGGKDSDAMLYHLLERAQDERWNGEVHLVHADLGRAEWKETPGYVESLARKTGVPLSVVRHTYGDLIDGIRRRMATRPDVPPFPSAAARWCTSDWKRSVISKWIRNTFPTGDVVCAMGLRAQESPVRAKRLAVDMRQDCCTRTRNVIDWLPIHAWNIGQVWGEIGYSLDEVRLVQAQTKATGVVPTDWGAHPAYARGNERLSCSMCILGSMNDLMNGAVNNTDAYRELCQIEIDSGFSFKKGFWLGALRPDLLTVEQRAIYRARNWIWSDEPKQMALL